MKSLKRDKNATKKNMQPYLPILFFGHPMASNLFLGGAWENQIEQPMY